MYIPCLHGNHAFNFRKWYFTSFLSSKEQTPTRDDDVESAGRSAQPHTLSRFPEEFQETLQLQLAGSLFLLFFFTLCFWLCSHFHTRFGPGSHLFKEIIRYSQLAEAKIRNQVLWSDYLVVYAEGMVEINSLWGESWWRIQLNGLKKFFFYLGEQINWENIPCPPNGKQVFEIWKKELGFCIYFEPLWRL